MRQRMAQEKALKAKKNEEEMIKAERIRMENKARKDQKRRELARLREIEKERKQEKFRQTATMAFATQ